MDKRTFLKLSSLVSIGSFLGDGLLIADTPPLAPLDQRQLFVLPKLPYAYDALTPAIDAQTMEIHHTKHHQAYVDKLNKAIEGAKNYQGLPLEDIMNRVKAEETAIRNNGGGHWNHSFFWRILTPKADSKPMPPVLEKAIEAAFESKEKLLEQIKSIGLKTFGSGWVWLILDEKKTLKVSSTPNQDNPLMKAIVTEVGIPILGIDVWEHAYYLTYQNERNRYLDQVFTLLDWKQIDKNYRKALKQYSRL